MSMYEVRNAYKSKKRFKKLLAKLSDKEKKSLQDRLKNNPYPSNSLGTELCIVERKSAWYGIKVTGGDRILYDIIDQDEDKHILLVFAGNHDDYLLFLRKHGKKKRH